MYCFISTTVAHGILTTENRSFGNLFPHALVFTPQ